MADTFLTQYELERKIKMLRFNQTESSNIDAKVTLNLKSDGDCAELIRDIVAFANTGQQCHIIVGIVNKTWVSKGIPEDSPLFDADKTQHQLNQVLANKLDPPLTIRYKTYPFGDISIGVISIKGEKFPYMISMKNDTGYGGEKSDGRKEKHIYNGQVFIRYGDSTIVASRQEDILEIVERRINTASALATLGMVTVLIGIVIGLGASFIRFSEPYSAAFLGCIVGAIVGGVFHERLTKYIGSYLSGEWNKLKPVAGFLWGAIVGAITSFWVVDSILKIGKVFNPFTIIVIVGIVMAPIIGTLVIIWPFAFFTIFKFVIHKITNRLKRI